MSYRDQHEKSRRTRNDPRRDRSFRGDDVYYGGSRSQREDWEQREFDNNEFDRREGMYDAGGRDFSELMSEAYPQSREERGQWARYSPMSGERPWYETVRNRRANFTGGDRGWTERRSGSLLEGVKNFFGRGPKGYRRSDERIKEDVSEALYLHPDVDASDIEVRVKDGHVTLSGTVGNRWMKRQAEDALEFIPGITDVNVDLTVAGFSDKPVSKSRKDSH